MTKKETASVLAELKNAYPLFYSNAKDGFGGVIDVWHEHIGRYGYGVVKKALHDLIGAETAVPTIAVVKKYICTAAEQESAIKQQSAKWREAGFESEAAYHRHVESLRR